MALRAHPWQLAAGAIILCGGAIGGAWWYRSRELSSAAERIACLPRGEAVVAYIDVAALRRSGLLDLIAGSRAAEELEYREFVERTGFDYRSDLDAVAVAFARDDVYFAVQGRFDWAKLDAYSIAKGGTCTNGFCRVASSQPGRKISYYPLRSGTMAMAVSRDGSAAWNVAERRGSPEVYAAPDQPVWITMPGVFLRDRADLPSGARSFSTALSTAERLSFSIGPDGDRLGVRAEIHCADAGSAAALAARLVEITDLFRKMLARDKLEPNPRDLSGVLAGGAFHSKDRIVTATWPLERAFVAALAGGTPR